MNPVELRDNLLAQHKELATKGQELETQLAGIRADLLRLEGAVQAVNALVPAEEEATEEAAEEAAE